MNKSLMEKALASKSLDTKKFVVEEAPGADFWEKYNELWHSSKDKSPFQAPLLLRLFSSISKKVIAAELIVDERLVGVIVLSKDTDNYSFLSDLKSDFNFFVFHPDCTEEDLYFFFTSFFSEVRERRWTLLLNRVPEWASYMSLFESCGSKSKLYFKKINYAVCPAVEGKENETVFEMVNHSRQYRYSVNRLRSQLKAVFEILTGDEQLEKWVDEFCQSHILRWENTTTPSKFSNLARQEFLLKCLKAWADQKILVRFSIIVEGKRIGFVIGLLEPGKLIHHSTTFHPDYRRFGAGKAVIYSMSQWMLENDLNTLDFGYGDEEYKSVLANKKQATSRIFVSPRTNLSFIVKSQVIDAIRRRPGIYRFYLEKIKRHVVAQ